MGMYAVGFIAAPAMVIEQNFDTTYDKYHLFISRLSGVAFLTVLYTLNSAVDVGTAVPIAVVMSCVTAVRVQWCRTRISSTLTPPRPVCRSLARSTRSSSSRPSLRTSLPCSWCHSSSLAFLHSERAHRISRAACDWRRSLTDRSLRYEGQGESIENRQAQGLGRKFTYIYRKHKFMFMFTCLHI